jgi:predicted small integral membrane protein
MTSQFGSSLDQQSESFDNNSDIGDIAAGVITPDAAPPVQHSGRRGFLPMKTNAFDRVFISVVCFVAINLLWMRFIEAYIPIWGAVVISLILAVIIIRWG